MADIEYFVPSRSNKCLRKSYFYDYDLNYGLIIIGDRVLFTNDLIGNRDTIGGDMWRTIFKIKNIDTLFVIDDNSNVIVLNLEE